MAAQHDFRSSSLEGEGSSTSTSVEEGPSPFPSATPLLLKARFSSSTPLTLRSGTVPSRKAATSPSTLMHQDPSCLTIGGSAGAPEEPMLPPGSNDAPSTITLRARNTPKED